MIDQLTQSLDALLGDDDSDQLDACVECNSPAPPGANRCTDCIGVAAD
ncbi:hypothetical protein [Halonotius terrestris]|nr:hypothetical protein [Halonotius terrestris]